MNLNFLNMVEKCKHDGDLVTNEDWVDNMDFLDNINFHYLSNNKKASEAGGFFIEKKVFGSPTVSFKCLRIVLKD